MRRCLIGQSGSLFATGTSIGNLLHIPTGIIFFAMAASRRALHMTPLIELLLALDARTAGGYFHPGCQPSGHPPASGRCRNPLSLHGSYEDHRYWSPQASHCASATSLRTEVPHPRHRSSRHTTRRFCLSSRLPATNRHVAISFTFVSSSVAEAAHWTELVRPMGHPTSDAAAFSERVVRASRNRIDGGRAYPACTTVSAG